MSDFNPTVEYRDVPEFPGYRIGDDGSVWSQWHARSNRSPRTWKQLKAGVDRDGYLLVVLRKDHRAYTRKVHRLVLEAFVGPCPDGMESRHLDRNPANNRLCNLRWGTHAENQADKVKHDTNCKGEGHRNSKLTNIQVLAIRAALAVCDTPSERKRLAQKYGVSRTLTYFITARKIWTHI